MNQCLVTYHLVNVSTEIVRNDEKKTYQMSFSELGSRTIRLSEGDRPVLAPLDVARAPDDVMAEPCS